MHSKLNSLISYFVYRGSCRAQLPLKHQAYPDVMLLGTWFTIGEQVDGEWKAFTVTEYRTPAEARMSLLRYFRDYVPRFEQPGPDACAAYALAADTMEKDQHRHPRIAPGQPRAVSDLASCNSCGESSRAASDKVVLSDMGKLPCLGAGERYPGDQRELILCLRFKLKLIEPVNGPGQARTPRLSMKLTGRPQVRPEDLLRPGLRRPWRFRSCP